MTYNIVSRLCPESLWDKYHPRFSHSTYNTRHCKDLEIPRYRTEFAKKGFITQLSHYGMIYLPKYVSDRHRITLKATENASKELDFGTQLPGRTATLRFDGAPWFDRTVAVIPRF